MYRLTTSVYATELVLPEILFGWICPAMRRERALRGRVRTECRTDTVCVLEPLQRSCPNSSEIPCELHLVPISGRGFLEGWALMGVANEQQSMSRDCSYPHQYFWDTPTKPATSTCFHAAQWVSLHLVVGCAFKPRAFKPFR